MARKTFEHGDAVEIQREVGRPWEPALYERTVDMSSRHGHHWVKLAPGSAPLYIDSMSGMHFEERDLEGRRYLTDTLIVPSIRVRSARKAGV